MRLLSNNNNKINEKNLLPECMGGKMVWPLDLGTIRQDSPCTHTVHQNLDTLLYCISRKMTLRCRRSGKSQRHKLYTHLFLQYYIFREDMVRTRQCQAPQQRSRVDTCRRSWLYWSWWYACLIHISRKRMGSCWRSRNTVQVGSRRDVLGCL